MVLSRQSGGVAGFVLKGIRTNSFYLLLISKQKPIQRCLWSGLSTSSKQKTTHVPDAWQGLVSFNIGLECAPKTLSRDIHLLPYWIPLLSIKRSLPQSYDNSTAHWFIPTFLYISSFSSFLSVLFFASFFFCCLSLFLHPQKTNFVERAWVLLFPCVSSHWWVQFPWIKSTALLHSQRTGCTWSTTLT